MGLYIFLPHIKKSSLTDLGYQTKLSILVLEAKKKKRKAIEKKS